MKPEDWLAAGYRRFDTRNEKLSDFVLQKRFDDEKGKKYFITVYVYDWAKYPQRTGEQYSFMPTVNFNFGGDKPFFDVSMNRPFDIAQCETEIERLWVHFGMPYYEEWASC